jgi:hypothetical protein
MRAVLASLIPVCLCLGCASTSLKRYAINQALSITDMRYRQVLHDLAVVANNSGSLPAFALTASGVANVTNTLSIDTATLWDQAVKGFSKETLAAFGQHNPNLQWTLDPVVSEPQLEGLYWACFWAIHGPPPEGSRAMELLRKPRLTDVNGCPIPGTAPQKPTYHLDVANQLGAIPRGWLHVTPRDCVPKDVAYKAICGDTAVWVTAEGLAWFSEFTLVMLDIATIDPTTLNLPRPTASVSIVPESSPVLPGGPFVNGTPKTDNPKVTELWDACQEVDTATAVGKIKLSRPAAFRQRSTEMLQIEHDPFTPPQSPGTPRLEAWRAASTSQGAK